MSIFQLGDFTLHSGQKSTWKIECDNLTLRDWMALARMASEFLPPFGEVEGVPRGGIALADCIRAYQTKGPLLLVDDVFTTGKSMEEQRGGRDAIGVVAFARGKTPSWIYPIFSLYQAELQRSVE